MKRFIILATLLISLISLSNQQSPAQDVSKMIDCIKVESFTHLTGIILDLYYNKITFKSFIDTYLEWSMRANVQEMNKCLPTEYYATSSNILSKLGLSLLYASNCEKDLGPSLIVLEQVIGNLENVKTQWKQALTNTLVFGLIGYQAFGDCKSALQNIRDIWSK